MKDSFRPDSIYRKIKPMVSRSNNHSESHGYSHNLGISVLPSTYEMRAWRVLHPEYAGLYEKFKDLYCYQRPVGSLMSRVPMMIRLGKDELSAVTLAFLEEAVSSWLKTRLFYDKTVPSVCKNATRNDAYFDNNRAGRYKALCLCLPEFKKEISEAHGQLSNTISNLYEAGFTPGAIAPLSEQILRRSA